jgi:hypothetical protein
MCAVLSFQVFPLLLLQRLLCPLVLDDLFAPAASVSLILSLDRSLHSLSAGEKPAFFGHLPPVFLFRTDAPDKSRDAEDDGRHDDGVGFPVGRLGIPTTGRRPDVLWVPGNSLSTVSRTN